MNADFPLRTALRELADGPPPPDLADRALARARRDRRRTVIALVAGVAVLAAAAMTIPAVALDRPAPAPAAAGPRLMVLGFSDPGPGGATEIYRSGRYAPTRWRIAIPSPDGRLVAVSSLEGGQRAAGIVAADRVDDPAAVRWLPDLHEGTPEAWSADGRRLLIRQPPRTAPAAAAYGMVYPSVVVDVATLATRTVRILLPERYLTVMRVLFGADGAGFAVSGLGEGLDHRPSAAGLLRLADDRGRVVRELEVADATLPDQPFSPDGRRVVLSSTRARVLDLATGEERGDATGRAAGWYDDGSYLVTSGSSLRRIELATGRVLGTWQLPTSGRTPTQVWLTRLAGPPPPGAIVL